MNKAELIEAIAKKVSGVSKRAVGDMLDAFTGTVGILEEARECHPGRLWHLQDRQARGAHGPESPDPRAYQDQGQDGREVLRRRRPQDVHQQVAFGMNGGGNRYGRAIW